MHRTSTLLKQISILLLFFFITTIMAQAQRPFVAAWLSYDPDDRNNLELTIPLEGTYDYRWTHVYEPELTGSGSGEGDLTINFPTPDIYFIEIFPTGSDPFHRIQLSDESGPSEATYRILNIYQWGDVKWSTMEYAFYKAGYLTGIAAQDVPNLQNVKSMAYAFSETSIGVNPVYRINSWNVSRVEDMSHLFDGASSVSELDLNSWNVGSVKDMSYMFANISRLETDITGWDVSNVENMSGMFSNNFYFNQDIGGWDVSRVKDMSALFHKADQFNKDISSWNVSSVENMSAMFSQTRYFNRDIGNWDVSNVTNMMGMFDRAKEFNQDLSKWDVSKVTDMRLMFMYAREFDQSLGDWNIQSLKNIDIYESGISCENYSKTLHGWVINGHAPDSVLVRADMIHYSSEVQTYRNYLTQELKWTIYSDREGDCPWSYGDSFITLWQSDNGGKTSMTQVEVPAIGSYDYYWENIADLNISGSGTATGLIVINFPEPGTYRLEITPVGAEPFSAFQFGDSSGNRGDATKLIDVRQWGNIEWESFEYAFYGATNLEVSASDIPNLTKVKNISYAFAYTSIESIPGLSEWEMTGIENLEGMFRNATKFNQDIKDWDVSSVKNMSYLFSGASKFNGNIGLWDVSQVETMTDILANAKDFAYSLENWDLSSLQATGNVDGNDISLANTALSCERFSIILHKWVDMVNLPKDIILDATGLEYSPDIETSLDYFSNEMNWQIKGIAEGGCEYVNQDDYFITIWTTDPYGGGSYGAFINIPAHGSFYYEYEMLDNPSIRGEGYGEDETELRILWPGEFRLKIKPVGENPFHRIQFGVPNDKVHEGYVERGDIDYLLEIEQWGTTEWSSMEYAYYRAFINITATDLPDLSKTKSMAHAFQLSGPLNAVRINDWDVSNVEDMSFMFYQSRFNQDISDWDVSSVKNMSNMFYATNFNQDINKWDVSNVEDMSSMFYLSKFNRALTNWNTGNVITMASMFERSEFNSDISNWNVSNVEDMSRMFALNNGFNQDISSWDVSSVETMKGMFSITKYFNQDLNDWDVSNVKNMYRMFELAESFNGNIGNWDVSNVEDISYMFAGAYTFNRDIGGWDLGSAVNMEGMFTFAFAFNQDIGNWDVSNVKNMQRTFRYALSFAQDINNWDVGNVTSLAATFEHAESFNHPLNDWNTGKVKLMSETFASAYLFNQSIDTWDVSNVKDMTAMFFSAQSYNQDMNSWEVSSVESTWYMFSGALGFNGNIEDWNVSSVKSMGSMFNNAKSFNRDISNWNTSNCTGMAYMFSGASKFNQDIGKWDVSKVTWLGEVLFNASSFDYSLENWNLASLKHMVPESEYPNDIGLGFSGMSCENYSRTLDGWYKNPNTASGIYLYAENLDYGPKTSTARATLRANRSWKFTGDSEGDCEFISVSTEDGNLATINFYPNPVNDILYISGIEKQLKIEVFDIAGRILKTVETSAYDIEINLSDLNSGIYFLRLASANGEVVTKKVVKQ